MVSRIGENLRYGKYKNNKKGRIEFWVEFYNETTGEITKFSGLPELEGKAFLDEYMYGESEERAVRTAWWSSKQGVELASRNMFKGLNTMLETRYQDAPIEQRYRVRDMLNSMTPNEFEDFASLPENRAFFEEYWKLYHTLQDHKMLPGYGDMLRRGATKYIQKAFRVKSADSYSLDRLENTLTIYLKQIGKL